MNGPQHRELNALLFLTSEAPPGVLGKKVIWGTRAHKQNLIVKGNKATRNSPPPPPEKGGASIVCGLCMSNRIMNVEGL